MAENTIIHEISLAGYKATSAGGMLDLGTWGSYGIEKLHLTLDAAWQDLTITAFFNVKGKVVAKKVVGKDGYADVPWEATKENTFAGRIVFEGSINGQRRISANLNYKVTNHSEITDSDPVPTDDRWNQFVTENKEYRDGAFEAAERANARAEDAEAASDDAQAAARAAKASENAAKASENAAAASENNASISAGAATVSEGNAAASAEKAKASETAAAESASNAAADAAKAASAAKKAADESVAANIAAIEKMQADVASKQTAAAASEKAAAASAVAAAGSAAQAETQKAAAAKSASDAQGYMQTAISAATDANTSAENAAGSKAAAASSATAAAGSATAAAGGAKTASDAAAVATDAKAAAVAAQKDAAASKAAAANSAAAAKTSEDAAAKSAADAGNTAKDIKDSMAQISENKEAVSQLKEDTAALQKRQNVLVGSETGNPVSCDDAYSAPLCGLTVYGKSKQDGTPTPDAPVPIVSAGDGGSVTVKATGKNLLNIPDGSGTARGITVTAKDGLISISGTATSSGYAKLDILPFIASGVVILSSSITSPKVKLVSETWSVILSSDAADKMSDMATKIVFIVTQGQTYNLTGVKVQLELGTTATAYSPYREQLLTLPTPNGLPGIPVASGGNYTDPQGQQWVCDEVDLERGVKVQRVDKAAFDSTKTLAEQNAILTTPIETQLTPTGIAAYKALITYAPNTVVQASDDAGIKLCYQRDVNLVVKNLEDAIASMTTT